MSGKTAPEIFEQVFLATRAKILEIAATLDRLDRADGSDQVVADARMEQIRQAINVVQSSRSADRAEQIQMIFSDQYDKDWPLPTSPR